MQSHSETKSSQPSFTLPQLHLFLQGNKNIGETGMRTQYFLIGGYPILCFKHENEFKGKLYINNLMTRRKGLADFFHAHNIQMAYADGYIYFHASTTSQGFTLQDAFVNAKLIEWFLDPNHCIIQNSFYQSCYKDGKITKSTCINHNASTPANLFKNKVVMSEVNYDVAELASVLTHIGELNVEASRVPHDLHKQIKNKQSYTNDAKSLTTSRSTRSSSNNISSIRNFSSSGSSSSRSSSSHSSSSSSSGNSSSTVRFSSLHNSSGGSSSNSRISRFRNSSSSSSSSRSSSSNSSSRHSRVAFPNVKMKQSSTVGKRQFDFFADSQEDISYQESIKKARCESPELRFFMLESDKIIFVKDNLHSLEICAAMQGNFRIRNWMHENNLHLRNSKDGIILGHKLIYFINKIDKQPLPSVFYEKFNTWLADHTNTNVKELPIIHIPGEVYSDLTLNQDPLNHSHASIHQNQYRSDPLHMDDTAAVLHNTVKQFFDIYPSSESKQDEKPSRSFEQLRALGIHFGYLFTDHSEDNRGYQRIVVLPFARQLLECDTRALFLLSYLKKNNHSNIQQLFEQLKTIQQKCRNLFQQIQQNKSVTETQQQKILKEYEKLIANMKEGLDETTLAKLEASEIDYQQRTAPRAALLLTPKLQQQLIQTNADASINFRVVGTTTLALPYSESKEFKSIPSHLLCLVDSQPSPKREVRNVFLMDRSGSMTLTDVLDQETSEMKGNVRRSVISRDDLAVKLLCKITDNLKSNSAEKNQSLFCFGVKQGVSIKDSRFYSSRLDAVEQKTLEEKFLALKPDQGTPFQSRFITYVETTIPGVHYRFFAITDGDADDYLPYPRSRANLVSIHNNNTISAQEKLDLMNNFQDVPLEIYEEYEKLVKAFKSYKEAREQNKDQAFLSKIEQSYVDQFNQLQRLIKSRDLNSPFILKQQRNEIPLLVVSLKHRYQLALKRAQAKGVIPTDINFNVCVIGPEFGQPTHPGTLNSLYRQNMLDDVEAISNRLVCVPTIPTDAEKADQLLNHKAKLLSGTELSPVMAHAHCNNQTQVFKNSTLISIPLQAIEAKTSAATIHLPTPSGLLSCSVKLDEALLTKAQENKHTASPEYQKQAKITYFKEILAQDGLNLDDISQYFSLNKPPEALQLLRQKLESKDSPNTSLTEDNSNTTIGTVLRILFLLKNIHPDLQDFFESYSTRLTSVQDRLLHEINLNKPQRDKDQLAQQIASIKNESSDSLRALKAADLNYQTCLITSAAKTMNALEEGDEKNSLAELLQSLTAAKSEQKTLSDKIENLNNSWKTRISLSLLHFLNSEIEKDRVYTYRERQIFEETRVQLQKLLTFHSKVKPLSIRQASDLIDKLLLDPHFDVDIKLQMALLNVKAIIESKEASLTEQDILTLAETQRNVSEQTICSDKPVKYRAPGSRPRTEVEITNLNISKDAATDSLLKQLDNKKDQCIELRDQLAIKMAEIKPLDAEIELKKQASVHQREEHKKNLASLSQAVAQHKEIASQIDAFNPVLTAKDAAKIHADVIKQNVKGLSQRVGINSVEFTEDTFTTCFTIDDEPDLSESKQSHLSAASFTSLSATQFKKEGQRDHKGSSRADAASPEMKDRKDHKGASTDTAATPSSTTLSLLGTPTIFSTQARPLSIREFKTKTDNKDEKADNDLIQLNEAFNTLYRLQFGSSMPRMGSWEIKKISIGGKPTEVAQAQVIVSDPTNLQENNHTHYANKIKTMLSELKLTITADDGIKKEVRLTTAEIQCDISVYSQPSYIGIARTAIPKLVEMANSLRTQTEQRQMAYTSMR